MPAEKGTSQVLTVWVLLKLILGQALGVAAARFAGGRLDRPLGVACSASLFGTIAAAGSRPIADAETLVVLIVAFAWQAVVLRIALPRLDRAATLEGWSRGIVGCAFLLLVPAWILSVDWGNASHTAAVTLPNVSGLVVWCGGLIAAVFGGGRVIARLLQPCLGQLGDEALTRGLDDGGRIIGWLERALIFLLVMVGQPAGIGFLLAAKSVLRFGEVKDATQRRLAEYIIIGTLMSFGWAIAVAYATWVVAMPMLR